MCWGSFKRPLSAALAAALLTVAGACTPDFEPPEIVNDLRFLSISAEPPEQILWRDPSTIPPEVGAWLLQALGGSPDPTALCRSDGPAPPATISSIAPVRITPLLVDPRVPEAELGSRAFDYQVWACSAEGSSCTESEGYRVKLERGKAPLEQIRYDFTPDGELFRYALCEDRLLGFGGLPIVVELRVFDPENDRWVIGAKRVAYTFWLPYSPVPAGKQANQNPEFEQIELTIKDADDQEVRKLRLADLGASPLTLRRDEKLRIVPEVTEASKERYAQVATPDPTSGQTEIEELQLEECDKGEKRSSAKSVQCGVFFSWYFYATCGSLSHQSTGGAPSVLFDNKKINDPSSEWRPPEKTDAEPAPPTEATLWIVGTDGRGGTMWRSLKVSIAASP
ncbi:MAG: hypothetical protein CSA65_07755 [Proteobacteria bacterium]|nr:MAG: hypothetical protein CSA65_07755 [Pseudomonadota bacterium]